MPKVTASTPSVDEAFNGWPASRQLLTTMELEAISVADPKQKKKVTFNRADADYSKGGFNPDGVYDTDKNSGWAVAGSDNAKSRVAIFAFTEPLGFTGETELKLTLNHESVHIQHVLGRFRISLTNDATPRLDAPPVEIIAHLLSPPTNGQTSKCRSCETTTATRCRRSLRA